MSLGFIPVIISTLLCEFITQDISIYIGAGVGLLFYLHSQLRKGIRIPSILLSCSTGILLLLSLTTLFVTLFTTGRSPSPMFPFMLEIVAVIPPLFIFLNRRRFLDYHAAQAGQCCCRQLSAQSAEAVVVSARVVLMTALLHFLIILSAALTDNPMDDTARYILFNVAPPAVFILCILFNQFGIFYFNLMMRRTAFMPVVNAKGDVIGKTVASEALTRKNGCIYPVVRIAVTFRGMPFLLPRRPCSAFEKGKVDLLMEEYLMYGETLGEGASRILKKTLPAASPDGLRFSLKYHFEDERTNRLVYLFTLEADDESVLRGKSFKDGKLWTFRQIEHELYKDFFSHCFEYEYEHLKAIICTREKYREFLRDREPFRATLLQSLS